MFLYFARQIFYIALIFCIYLMRLFVWYIFGFGVSVLCVFRFRL